MDLPIGIKFSDLVPLPAVGPFDTPPILAVALAGNDTYQVNYDVTGGWTRVTQPGHGFIVGDAVYATAGGIYALAQADLATTMEAVGLVVAVGAGGDADDFFIQFKGLATIGAVAGGRYTGNLTAGSVYYLSQTTAGAGVTTAPNPEQYSKPLFVALSTTVALVVDDRAALVGHVPFIDFTQGAGGDFIVGDAVRLSGGSFAKAIASAVSTSTGVGIITRADGANYRVAYYGWVDVGNVAGGRYTGAFTVGQQIYLSASVAGAGTTTVPGSGAVEKPLLMPVSGVRALIIQQAPRLIPQQLVLNVTTAAMPATGGVQAFTITGAVEYTARARCIAVGGAAGFLQNEEAPLAAFHTSTVSEDDIYPAFGEYWNGGATLTITRAPSGSFFISKIGGFVEQVLNPADWELVVRYTTLA